MTTTERIQETARLTTPKGWLIAPAVGVVATTGVMGSGAGFSVTDDLPVETMLESASASLLVVGAVQALAAMALVVFGAWIFARLRAVEPEGALTSRCGPAH